jgi:DNA-binding NarL/FixJ family response regulator/signal transduction histidine kinase
MFTYSPKAAQIMQFISPHRLLRQFGIAAFFSIVGGMAATGAWLTKEIQDGVIENTTLSTAVFMERFVLPHIVELKSGRQLSKDAIAKLDGLTKQGLAQSHIASAKIWLTDGTVAYSTDHLTIGKKFPPEEPFLAAAAGTFASEYSELNSLENLYERTLGKELIEIYIPMIDPISNKVFAIGEFYIDANALPGDINRSYMMSWLVVGLVTVAMLLPLFLIVRRGDKIINLQDTSLKNRVSELSKLLEENQDLVSEVRRASLQSTKISESFLNRIGADLHDGPVQLLALSVLLLDNLSKRSSFKVSADSRRNVQQAKTTITDALKELRTVAGGLILPELNGKSLFEIITIVVEAYKMRTNSAVQLEIGSLPEIKSTVLNNTVYRFIQEGLNNSFQHAGAKGQRVTSLVEEGNLVVEVSDSGHGFKLSPENIAIHRLGISAMRNRVVALGGQFKISSRRGKGTTLRAQFPLELLESHSVKEFEEVLVRDLVKVAIVDDHPLLLDGVKTALGQFDEFEIVGTGATLQDAVLLTQSFNPEIMILDIGIHGGGVEAARQVSKLAPLMKVVMFTASGRPDHVNSAIAAGALGYVLKGASSSELCDCIRTVHNGKRYITPELAMSILSPTKAPPESGSIEQQGAMSNLSRRDFTGREIDVIELLSSGKNNRAIAQELNLSEKTVKHHMSSIMEKLQVKSRLSAALLLAQWKD